MATFAAEHTMTALARTDIYAPIVLHLLGGPYVTVGGDLRGVPECSLRLLVFVALHQRRVDRRFAAGALWAGGGEDRAAGNLRSALWRLRGVGVGVDLLTTDKVSIALHNGVIVDAHAASDWASRLVAGEHIPADLDLRPTVSDTVNLLPGWYDEWVLIERERVRQQVLHGLEAQSRALVRAGRLAEAVHGAITAVGAEPLRESAQRVLIEAHLAENNLAEARRAFEAYRRRLHEELQVEPSADLRAYLDSHPPCAPGGVSRGRTSG